MVSLINGFLAHTDNTQAVNWQMSAILRISGKGISNLVEVTCIPRKIQMARWSIPRSKLHLFVASRRYAKEQCDHSHQGINSGCEGALRREILSSSIVHRFLV